MIALGKDELNLFRNRTLVPICALFDKVEKLLIHTKREAFFSHEAHPLDVNMALF